jgi:outer membrane protein assembly factor BamA
VTVLTSSDRSCSPDKVGGYTKMDSIKRNLILKEGQLMNGETLRENKQLLHSMGIFADVNIIPTEVFDGGECCLARRRLYISVLPVCATESARFEMGNGFQSQGGTG